MRVRPAPSTVRSANGPPPHEWGGSATTLAGQAGILFGWTPDTFWAATPAELAALARVAGRQNAVAAAPIDLDTLLKRFPDE